MITGPIIRAVIAGIPREIETGHVKTMFVHGLGIERLTGRHIRHTDQRMMIVQVLQFMKVKRVGAWSDDDLFPEGNLQVQVASAAAGFRKHRNACTHKEPPVMQLRCFLLV